MSSSSKTIGLETAFSTGRLPAIRDIAKAAGVSVGTASKALNGQGRLRAETRARVQAVAEQHGFRPVAVPAQIAVVGYDNWEIVAAATRPPLTSIDINLHALGRLAGIKLLEQIDGRNGGHKESGVQRLPCRLVARFSCGASQTLAAKRKGDKANQR